MSIYYINEHVLSANVRAVISDEHQKATFVLVGKWGRANDVVTVYNMNGDALASATQVASVTPAMFDLHIGDQKVGVLRHRLSVKRGFYSVRELKWLATAHFKRQEYSIRNLHGRLMKMKKQTTYQGDMYRIEVKDDNLAPLCICIGAVLDYWSRVNQKENKLNQSLIYGQNMPTFAQCIEEDNR